MFRTSLSSYLELRAMTTTEPALRATPRTLNRITVHQNREDHSWMVETGAPTPVLTTPEWAEATAEAQRVATKWRTHFAAFGW